MLGVDRLAAAHALMACRDLAAASLRLEDGSSESVAAILPAGLDPRLAKLIASQVSKALPAWRQAAVRQAPSLPRLEKVSWAVSMGSGSDSAQRSGVPGVRVQCDVTAQPSRAGAMPSTSPISFEMTKETLGVLMEGFGRIRDQLDSLAGSTAAASASAGSS